MENIIGPLPEISASTNHNHNNQQTHTMKVQVKRIAKKGFSLVELLVVIAVIGIMAAIAIPQISNINKNSQIAKDKRNAQNIASVYTAALAAGAAVNQDTLATAITDLAGGINGTGQFSTTSFKTSVSATEAGYADDFLSLAGGVITYNPDATSSR
jgi:prepilin-type N-terminal cleavage/methylation domain-containing protein